MCLSDMYPVGNAKPAFNPHVLKDWEQEKLLKDIDIMKIMNTLFIIPSPLNMSVFTVTFQFVSFNGSFN